MSKNFGGSKLNQNVKALFFILNFVSISFLTIWWVQIFLSAFSIKFEIWKFSDIQIIILAGVLLVCYTRFYLNYLKNKAYK